MNSCGDWTIGSFVPLGRVIIIIGIPTVAVSLHVTELIFCETNCKGFMEISSISDTNGNVGNWFLFNALRPTSSFQRPAKLLWLNKKKPSRGKISSFDYINIGQTEYWMCTVFTYWFVVLYVLRICWSKIRENRNSLNRYNNMRIAKTGNFS